ncbi:MAG: type II toxin-antitoxin system RelE/ParE family toxin [Rikenellaceae bacterium]|jgi:toxin ParE1/3/4|nr:type II toxin-antitoxin system RelE/ParE family toxin [Rikenellaceae bacterium]
MAKLRFTNKAVEDLADIWNCTLETWSERQVDLYYGMIMSVCEDIAANPAFGRNYDLIAEDIFGFVVHKHVIFYKITSQDEVLIVRILHGSMDLKNRIRE